MMANNTKIIITLSSTLNRTKIAFVYNYKNNNEEYFEVIKSIEDKISDLLSNKKMFFEDSNYFCY